MRNINEIIDEAFITILRHLKSIDIKVYRKLIKTQLYACYDVRGEFLGTSQDKAGLINIKLNNLGKTKKDGIQREVLLEKDYFMLDCERALRKKING